MSSPSPRVSEHLNATEFEAWRCGDKYKFPPPVPEKDPWAAIDPPLFQKDDVRCQVWKDEVQNLLIFAGLFSAVVTAFIIEAYKTLKQDPNEALLSYFLTQPRDGNGFTQQGASSSPPQFSPTSSNIRINILWFLSLVFSLATVLIGIISLQWLREHQRPVGDIEPQIAFSLRVMSIDSLDKWYFPQIFTFLPLLLQIGLVLFLSGLIDFLWSLNHTVATFVSFGIGLTLSLFLITTVLPSLQPLMLFLPRWRKSSGPRAPCPYKSPQSWAFHRLIAPIVHFCMQIRSIELDKYRRLDARNITSVENRAFWYHGIPQATAFIFRKKKGDTWLEYGIAWLFQRDRDYMEAEQGINVSRKLKERPIPLYDAVQGLLDAKKSLSPKAQKDLSLVDYCWQPLMNSNVMEGSPYYDFLHRLARRSQLLTYGLPAGIQSPSPDVLRDNTLLLLYSRDDSFDNMPLSMRQHGIEICIRLTKWLYAHPEPRQYIPDGIPAPGLPIQWVARHLEHGLIDDFPGVQEQVVDILHLFFHNSKNLRPASDDLLGKTLHTNKSVRHFLFSAAAIIARRGDVSYCDTLFESIATNLHDLLDGTPAASSDTMDYVFYTVLIFSQSLLFQSAISMTDSLRKLLRAIQEYQIHVQPATRDLERHLGADHRGYSWSQFAARAATFGVLGFFTPTSDSDEQKPLSSGDAVVEIVLADSQSSDNPYPHTTQDAPAIIHAPPAAPVCMHTTQQAGQPSLAVGFVATPANVEIGPLVWGRDIAGQVRALINHLPDAHLLSQNVQARHGRPDFVLARFPSNVDAIQFVNAWRRDTPAEFAHISVTHERGQEA